MQMNQLKRYFNDDKEEISHREFQANVPERQESRQLQDSGETSDVSQYFRNYCETNEDCVDPSLCCSIAPLIVGKRLLDGNLDKNYMLHYCMPYKNESATWCHLRLQYSPEIPNYHDFPNGCPCAPGLKCTPSTDLPLHYPKDRYGKCTKTNP
ncbi:unnamed protein product [Mytilus coruscus]|uniref:Uncharacterized protein n=1 Tax=Mytilus coruscus TaxID=42192 RepID=A0A6J8ENB6_MYTCO|nr:unnamed protein product [Mytilus coruscus]